VGVSIPLMGRRIPTLRPEHIGSSCSSLGFVVLYGEEGFFIGKKTTSVLDFFYLIFSFKDGILVTMHPKTTSF
jgi:hypothetical protein